MSVTVRRAIPGLVAGLCLGLLALGPGLRRGFLLSYDMLFVPREPFGAALPGLAPPRAVPSDLAIAAAARIAPADVTQKLVLLAVFVLGCAGTAALLGREPVLARLAGGVFYVWNPYVGERLILGQWALLLGYAGLPWVLRAVLRTDEDPWRWTGQLCLSLVPAVIGGFAAMAITALVVVPAAVLTGSARRAGTALAALTAGSLPWLVPAVQHTVYADPAGVAAFAARADTPFGALGSLLMLGGAWNAQTVPTAYGGAWSALWLVMVIVALAGYLAGLRGASTVCPGGPRWPGLGIAAAAGLLIACLGVTAAGRDLLRSATGTWPGAAVFRDAQQFVAPLALAEAAGFGVAVSRVMNPGSFRATARKPGRPLPLDAAGAVLGVLALLAPVLLLPGLAWGAAGRLRPAAYPAQWLAAARMIDAAPGRGDVLILPWQTYRTPSWNHGEVVIDPWSRLLSRPVIWNDGTQVGDVELAPDDPRARRLDGVIRGGGPLTAALRAAGVRFVLEDADGPGQRAGARLPGAVVLVDQPGLTVYRLPG
ncbi:MAG: hypothetical protein JO037_19530 [Actinobacteria bacterium]|nr:hypothetical protein [Actinomycetota bacterium]